MPVIPSFLFDTHHLLEQQAVASSADIAAVPSVTAQPAPAHPRDAPLLRSTSSGTHTQQSSALGSGESETQRMAASVETAAVAATTGSETSDEGNTSNAAISTASVLSSMSDNTGRDVAPSQQRQPLGVSALPSNVSHVSMNGSMPVGTTPQSQMTATVAFTAYEVVEAVPERRFMSSHRRARRARTRTSSLHISEDGPGADDRPGGNSTHHHSGPSPAHPTGPSPPSTAADGVTTGATLRMAQHVTSAPAPTSINAHPAEPVQRRASLESRAARRAPTEGRLGFSDSAVGTSSSASPRESAGGLGATASLPSSLQSSGPMVMIVMAPPAVQLTTSAEVLQRQLGTTHLPRNLMRHSGQGEEVSSAEQSSVALQGTVAGGAAESQTQPARSQRHAAPAATADHNASAALHVRHASLARPSSADVDDATATTTSAHSWHLPLLAAAAEGHVARQTQHYATLSPRSSSGGSSRVPRSHGSGLPSHSFSLDSERGVAGPRSTTPRSPREVSWTDERQDTTREVLPLVQAGGAAASHLSEHDVPCVTAEQLQRRRLPASPPRQGSGSDSSRDVADQLSAVPDDGGVREQTDAATPAVEPGQHQPRQQQAVSAERSHQHDFNNDTWRDERDDSVGDGAPATPNRHGATRQHSLGASPALLPAIDGAGARSANQQRRPPQPSRTTAPSAVATPSSAPLSAAEAAATSHHNDEHQRRHHSNSSSSSSSSRDEGGVDHSAPALQLPTAQDGVVLMNFVGEVPAQGELYRLLRVHHRHPLQQFPEALTGPPVAVRLPDGVSWLAGEDTATGSRNVDGSAGNTDDELWGEDHGAAAQQRRRHGQHASSSGSSATGAGAALGPLLYGQTTAAEASRDAAATGQESGGESGSRRRDAPPGTSVPSRSPSPPSSSSAAAAVVVEVSARSERDVVLRLAENPQDCVVDVVMVPSVSSSSPVSRSSRSAGGRGGSRRDSSRHHSRVASSSQDSAQTPSGSQREQRVLLGTGSEEPRDVRTTGAVSDHNSSDAASSPSPSPRAAASTFQAEIVANGFFNADIRERFHRFVRERQQMTAALYGGGAYYAASSAPVPASPPTTHGAAATAAATESASVPSAPPDAASPAGCRHPETEAVGLAGRQQGNAAPQPPQSCSTTTPTESYSRCATPQSAAVPRHTAASPLSDVAGSANPSRAAVDAADHRSPHSWPEPPRFTGGRPTTMNPRAVFLLRADSPSGPRTAPAKTAAVLQAPSASEATDRADDASALAHAHPPSEEAVVEELVPMARVSPASRSPVSRRSNGASRR